MPENDARQAMRKRIRALGLRATSSRLSVLVCLHDHARPLSHLELMEQLGPNALERATVYRILSDLSEAGLLRRMDLGDKIWRYELSNPCCRTIPDQHAHFLCLECKQVTCLPELELRPVGGGSLPVELKGADLQLRITGRCGSCVAS